MWTPQCVPWSRRTTPPSHLKVEGTPKDLHRLGYLWVNIHGRYLRRRLVAQTLHTAPRRPTVILWAKAQSR